MKNIPKVTLIALAASLLGSGLSLADDSQLQNILALQRHDEMRRSTTIGVYAQDRSVGHRRSSAAAKPELRLMRKDVPQGTPVFYFAPVR